MTRINAIADVAAALLESPRLLRDAAYQEACRRIEGLDTALHGPDAGYAEVLPDEAVRVMVEEIRRV